VQMVDTIKGGYDSFNLVYAFSSYRVELCTELFCAITLPCIHAFCRSAMIADRQKAWIQGRVIAQLCTLLAPLGGWGNSQRDIISPHYDVYNYAAL